MYGKTLFDTWNPQNAGGTPKGGKGYTKWLTNPQFKLTLNSRFEANQVKILFEQVDQRLVYGNTFPFKEEMKTLFLAVYKMSDEKEVLTAKWFNKSKMYTYMIKKYRQASEDMTLRNGTYILVPSTRLP